ncbi:MAG: AAA family ATPase, partial [Proteobacteria bacterium]|nr:AAA family ATPase [Pseudomonadota bacterium]
MAVRDYAQMVYDMSLRRGLIVIGNDIAEGAQRISIDTTPSEHIAEAEQKLYILSEQGQVERGFQGFVVSTADAIKQIHAAYKRDGSLAGISTGLDSLDEILGGLQKSDLLILAGRPSMGKTALATNIAYNVAKAYKKGKKDDGTEGTIAGGIVGFFSLEMSSEQLAGRILSEATELPSYKIRSGNINETEFRQLIDAAKILEKCPLYIDDTPAVPINQLATRARRLKRTHGLDLLVVDYLQLVRPARANPNRVNEVSEITQGLKAIAKELNIPVIALSQLSRA